MSDTLISCSCFPELMLFVTPYCFLLLCPFCPTRTGDAPRNTRSCNKVIVLNITSRIRFVRLSYLLLLSQSVYASCHLVLYSTFLSCDARAEEAYLLVFSPCFYTPPHHPVIFSFSVPVACLPRVHVMIHFLKLVKLIQAKDRVHSTYFCLL